MSGETVGGYRIISRLAEGAAGEICLAEHASVGAQVALKLVSAELSADRERTQRYLREAQAASRVGHAGTVKISDVGQPPEGRAFLVMEALQGESLARRIAKTGRLSITQIAELGRQLAAVLAALHDEHLVHRDVRPDKIFLVRDSGLAHQEKVKLLVGDSLLLGPGHPRLAAYQAPEVWRDPSTADWRADAYALGCVIFEMACGRPPFARTSSEDLRARHLDQPAPTARSQMPDVPPALDALLGKLLAKAPDDRPRSMREIGRAFEALGGAARPLAPTLQDTPVLVIGELHAPTLPPGPAVEHARVPAAPPSAWLRYAVPVAVALVIGVIVAILLAMR